MDERVQIFIPSHKPCERAESRFVRTVMQADVIRDLEGGDERDRFMAAHANEFCELLTQYWAWKRCGAPYVGFGHYRRYFEFNDSVKSNAYCMVKRDLSGRRGRP